MKIPCFFLISVLFFISIVNIAEVKATVSVTYPISDSLVLQRNMLVPIWGKATAGESVTVTFNNQVKTTKAGADGNWKIKLDSMVAAGPLTMTIKGTNTITLRDLYVGEVWNCAGQSNMDTRLSYYSNYADTVKNAKNPLLRFIDIRYTLITSTKGWKTIRPASAGNCSATAYFFGQELQRRLGCAVGLMVTAVGGTYVEQWLDPATLAADPNMVLPAKITAKGDMFNQFIAPVLTYGIKGTICMHGEQNAGDTITAPLYGERFRTMIKAWRNLWGQGNFPFYFGQLTMFNSKSTVDTLSPIVQVREGQRQTMRLPNMGMSVNIDISGGGWHFSNKYAAGRRLALPVLAEVYNMKGFEYYGPLYQGMGIQGDKIRVLFNHIGTGMKTRDAKAVSCFAIAGEDNIWYTASSAIDGNTIILYSASVPKPVKACYGYGNWPVSNLVNNEGFSASPFRTDTEAWPDGLGQTLTFNAIPAKTYGDADFNPGAFASSGLSAAYTSSNINVATVTNDGFIHIVGVGSCQITASQKGNSIFRPSITLKQSLVVNKVTQSIEFAEIAPVIYGHIGFNLTASASTDLPITYSSSNTKVATVASDGRLQIIGAGTTTIKASQAGNAVYNPGEITRMLVVNKAALQVQVADTSRVFKMRNPPFRIKYSGFVNNDNQDKLVVKPMASCVADSLSLPGFYPVTVSGGSDTNYNFSYTNGTLTILESTGVNSVEIQDLMMYPNPPIKFICVAHSCSDELMDIGVFDVQGNQVLNHKNLTNAQPIDVSLLLPGVYLAKIMVGNKLSVRRFIKL